jgi:hypothetical protein
MTEDAFTAEQAILVAKAAGLDVSDLERQGKQPAGSNALRTRVKELEQQLEELAAKQEPQGHEHQFVNRLAGGLAESQSSG